MDFCDDEFTDFVKNHLQHQYSPFSKPIKGISFKFDGENWKLDEFSEQLEKKNKKDKKYTTNLKQFVKELDYFKGDIHTLEYFTDNGLDPESVTLRLYISTEWPDFSCMNEMGKKFNRLNKIRLETRYLPVEELFLYDCGEFSEYFLDETSNFFNHLSELKQLKQLKLTGIRLDPNVDHKNKPDLKLTFKAFNDYLTEYKGLEKLTFGGDVKHIVCLACGLYYFAELVEEHASIAKRVIKYTIITTIVLLLFLFIFEDISTSCLLASLVSHGTYLTLLTEFPFVTLTSLKFILSFATFLISHFSWFFYFRSNWFPINEIIAIFTFCVWLVPMIFFISLAANDNALPFSSSSLSSSSSSSSFSSSNQNSFDSEFPKKKSRTSVLKSMIGWIKKKTNDFTGSNSISRHYY
eukprot:gene3564-4441_t